MMIQTYTERQIQVYEDVVDDCKRFCLRGKIVNDK